MVWKLALPFIVIVCWFLCYWKNAVGQNFDDGVQLNTTIWGMSRGCLVIINVGKGKSEKAVASLWLVVYMAVGSSC